MAVTSPTDQVSAPSVALGRAERDGGVFGALVDLSRARQALLSVAQPALGAVLAARGLPDGRTIVLGLIAASTGYLAVFSLNDVFDRRVDARALAAGKAEFEGRDIDTAFMRHPLARGGISLGGALLWVGLLAACAVVTAAALNPACLGLLGIAVLLEAAYCTLRSATWAKTFVSGVMVGVGGLAGWAAVRPFGPEALGFFAFLALWEISGRNLPNDLADIAADSRTGVRTVATTFGSDASARAVAAGSALTMTAAVALPVPEPAVAVLGPVAFLVLAPVAVRLVLEPRSSEAASFFNRASLLPVFVLPVAIIAFELPW